MSQSDATAKKKQRPQVKPIGQPGGNKTTGGSGLTGPAPAGPPRDSEDWSKSGTYHLKEIGVKISTTGVSKVGEGAPAPGEQPRPQTAPDDVLDPDNLVEERLLGKGASGMVVLYKDKTNGKQYAVKIISLNTATAAADSKMIAEEIKSIDQQCPYLVSAHTAFLREKRLHVVQEYIDKGSLYDILRSHQGTIAENIVAKIAEQVLHGLAYLHGVGEKGGKSKMHRDLKPANILVCSNGFVKISDFGVATNDKTKGHSTFVGTTTYMSPERIKGEKYSVQSDIWAAGLVFAECLLGYYPFRSSRTTFIELLVQITKEQKFDFPAGTSDNCKNFIMACLRQNPEERPKAADLLQHPYIKNCTTTLAQVAPVPFWGDHYPGGDDQEPNQYE
eukprot:CAMPEP_0174287784 /NCGR_PEP_ID=MMETSP0809-20121228/17578_1 /TAXON_ID=73025 ORGANISM="Eutreptiella gymnastica-like, Strain CCMP1594" /NCGR_SAMPLE_ID=MMETSP0809 /ASSEMBLY_ACC=CAM_ASM_000658 /LENGTH=388 /DNA_ID=CAMNT_0015384537 /DNA_START=47 /DNA_END=1212 /DNA_ORIENTATION=+